MNVGAQYGLEALPHVYIGNSVSFHDFDHDGWDDVTIASPFDSLIVYRNVQGALQRLPAPLPTHGPVKQVIWADIDNDGDDDVLSLAYEGPLTLWLNNGQFSFTDHTSDSGLPMDNAPYTSATFADYDRDGFLDLYVTSFWNGMDQVYGMLDHLYRNNGDGTFTDVTLTSGVNDGYRPSLQSVWFDHNNDGWPDLYSISDRTPLNTLFLNNTDGTFTDITSATGTGLPQTDAMSAALGDPDNDGDLDIYVTNQGTIVDPNMPCRLLMRNGDGTYTDQAASYGLACDHFGWGAVWLDADNDTRQDLFVATEGGYGNRFYRNGPGSSFTPSTELLVDNPLGNTFAAARGDLDNDGYPDLIVGSVQPDADQVWLNQGDSGNNHALIRLTGTVSNRMAIGSWIRVFANGAMQVRYTTCGENYLSQDSQQQHFGLGDAPIIDSILVTYLSGHVDRYYDLPVNGRHAFEEGETYSATITALGPSSFCTGGSVTLDAGEHATYLWSTGHTERYLQVTQSGSYTVSVSNAIGISATSEAFSVTEHALPDILVTVSAPSCADSFDGSIALQNLEASALDVVTWSHGASGAALDGLGAGNYQYAAQDANGCASSGNVLLTAPPELVLVVDATPVELGNDGAIQAQGFGGTPPLQLFLDGLAWNGASSGLSVGGYVISLADANACTRDSTVWLGDATGIAGQYLPAPYIQPNPGNGTVHFRNVPKVMDIRVLGTDGREVLHATGGDSMPLDLGTLPAGTYALHCQAPQWSHVIVLVHQP